LNLSSFELSNSLLAYLYLWWCRSKVSTGHSSRTWEGSDAESPTRPILWGNVAQFGGHLGKVFAFLDTLALLLTKPSLFEAHTAALVSVKSIKGNLQSACLRLSYVCS